MISLARIYRIDCVYLQDHENGVCHFTLLENLLSKVKSVGLLESLGNKISFALVQLSEFEKVSLRPSLSRPRMLKATKSTRLSQVRWDYLENHLWVSSDNLQLKPSIETLNDNRPSFYFLYEGKAS